MKTRPLLFLSLTPSVLIFNITLLLTPATARSAAFLPPPGSSDTIEVYLFQQLCAGETFNGLVWQQDTVATFFRSGATGTDTLQTVEIDVAPLPNFALAGDSLLCPRDSGMLSVVGFFSTYQWSNGDSTQSITLVMPGSYMVTVTASNGCSGTKAVAVVVSSPDFVIDSYNPICAGAADGAISINNFFGGQAPYEVSLNGGDFQTDSSFENLVAGNYLLRLRDAVGCTDSVMVGLMEPALFTIDIGLDIFLVSGDTLRLAGIATDSVKTWHWQPARLFDCIDCPRPLIVRPATAAVSLTVTNAAGCTASDELVITYDGEVRLFVPNIFSPNGDGKNDWLTVVPGKGNWEVVNFLLFDRWGSAVFESETPIQYPQMLEWDGRSRGRLLFPGVYSWTALLRFSDGSEEVQAGDVTIVR